MLLPRLPLGEAQLLTELLVNETVQIKCQNAALEVATGSKIQSAGALVLAARARWAAALLASEEDWTYSHMGVSTIPGA